MGFEYDPIIEDCDGEVGEQITVKAGIGIYEWTFRDDNTAIINVGNGIFDTDQLRELADEIDEFYSEPTFEERVHEVADDFELDVENASTYEVDFKNDAELSWDDDATVSRVVLFETLDEFCSTINFSENSVWVEETLE
jgi:hypothetical protein